VDNIYFHPANLDVYTHKPPGFWRRQFNDSPTRAQLRFDIAFGLVIPVLCFVFDPIIFRGDILAINGVYHQFRFFAYTASAFEIVTLACWLFLVRDFPAWSRPAGGVMLAGALFSFTLGVVILPLSLIGLIFAGLGALGFIPFVTAIVYLRNARRALRLNRTGAPVRGGAAASFVFGLALALGAPAVAQRVAKRVVRSASAGALAGAELSPPKQHVMRALTFLSGETFEDLVKQYEFESEPASRDSIAKTYWEMTGEDIDAARCRMQRDD